MADSEADAAKIPFFLFFPLGSVLVFIYQPAATLLHRHQPSHT